MPKLDRMKEVRNRLGLKQRTVAEMAEMEPSAISHLERLDRDARPSTVKRIAEAMGVSPEDLYSTDGEKIARSTEDLDLGPNNEQEYYERLERERGRTATIPSGGNMVTAERVDSLEQQVEILERLTRLERRVEALGAALGDNDSVSLSIPTLLRSVADAIESSNPAPARGNAPERSYRSSQKYADPDSCGQA